MVQLELFKQKSAQWWEKVPENICDEFKGSEPEFKSKEEYYLSNIWQGVRRRVLKRDGHKCRKCGKRYGLQIHHLTYDRLYHEHDDDLITLCITCHKQADNEREYFSAMDTYMTKKYGEMWEYDWDREVAEEEFTDWLDHKREYGDIY